MPVIEELSTDVTLSCEVEVKRRVDPADIDENAVILVLLVPMTGVNDAMAENVVQVVEDNDAILLAVTLGIDEVVEDEDCNAVIVGESVDREDDENNPVAEELAVPDTVVDIKEVKVTTEDFVGERVNSGVFV